MTATNTTETEKKKTEKPAKKRRGFAVMDKARVLAIASQGGKAAHEKGTAHKFSAEEARAAGKKGGLAPRKKRESREAEVVVDNQPDA